MRIALMTDIHGNLAALDAVLRDIERRAVDMTVNLGDVVSGPLLPRATAERLMPLGLPTIRGNHERQILTQSLGELGESDHFAALELLDEQRAWLASFPETLALDGDVLLCHGTPQNDLDYLLETIDADGFRPATVAEVVERTAGCTARLIACGHSHLPRAMRLRNGTMVLNPGSVGQPRDNDARASFAILDTDKRTWRYERVSYPIELTQSQMRDAHLPRRLIDRLSFGW